MVETYGEIIHEGWGLPKHKRVITNTSIITVNLKIVITTTLWVGNHCNSKDKKVWKNVQILTHV